MILDSSPMISHGSILEGVLGPPASNPGDNFVRVYTNKAKQREKWRIR